MEVVRVGVRARGCSSASCGGAGLELESAELSGTVHALDSSNNVVHADGNAVVLYGVHDLVVVSREGLTLVTTTERALDLKKLIDTLPPRLRGST